MNISFLSRSAWWPALASGLVVLAVQLWLVAGAGTDVPFQDQWDVEGQGLYPRWVDSSGSAGDLLAPHNEHRIFWTKLLALALFAADGQWDPLVQLAANAGLHAALVVLLVWGLTNESGAGARWLFAGLTALLQLPLPAWHNALWGFQSQVYFVEIFALGAFTVFAPGKLTLRRQVMTCLVTFAALVAMGAGLLVPLVLVAATAWRVIRGEGRWPALVAPGLLAILAFALREVPVAHAALGARSLADFFGALGRLLAWPYAEQPVLALLLNLPLLVWVVTRLRARTALSPRDQLIASAAAWVVLTLAAAAWSRGGSAEFAAGIPSRYVDFVVLLPLLNLAALVGLAATAPSRWRLAAAAWVMFLVVGWGATAVAPWRHIVRPRLADRDAPVRLVREFQRTRDPAVFAGQPRLLLPHPQPAVVLAVLEDPRLQGHLPPSLQPDRPMGPLSRAARALLGR